MTGHFSPPHQCATLNSASQAPSPRGKNSSWLWRVVTGLFSLFQHKWSSGWKTLLDITECLFLSIKKNTLQSLPKSFNNSAAYLKMQSKHRITRYFKSLCKGEDTITIWSLPFIKIGFLDHNRGFCSPVSYFPHCQPDVSGNPTSRE